MNITPETNVVRLWNGTLVDLNKVLAITDIDEHRGDNSPKLSFDIVSGDGKISIKEMCSSYYYKGNYHGCPSWRLLDGTWKETFSITETLFYHQFKEKYDSLINYWTKNKPIVEIS